MVADLFQGKNHLQDKSLTLEKGFVVGGIEPLDFRHGCFERAVVEGGLLRSECSIIVQFYLVRQVGDDALVGLHTAHHEGSGHLAEAAQSPSL